eukprot:Seg1593.2 transcript_id=Seg1593.2/GoldUCD/mRNA.D3Y31 product="hypothetical protein" protein_id=Seg1593.2/GoldUCD/D3Y31
MFLSPPSSKAGLIEIHPILQGTKNLEVSPLQYRRDGSSSLDNRDDIESHNRGVAANEVQKVASVSKIAIPNVDVTNNTELSNGAEGGSCEERYRDESCCAKESGNHEIHSSSQHETNQSKLEAMKKALDTGDKANIKEAFSNWLAVEGKNETEQCRNQKKNRVVCPVDGCEKSIIDLIRHLKSVHKWDEKRAVLARGQFGLRKTREIMPGRKRKNYTAKMCPMITCGKTVLRLGNHLRQTHNLSDKSHIKMLVDAGQQVKHTIPDCNDESTKRSAAAPAMIAGAQRQCSNSEIDVYEPDLSDSEDDAASIASLYDDEIEIVPTFSEKSLFGTFKKWLMSLDGGDKKEVNAKLHVSQLLTICRHLQASTEAGGECSNVIAIFEADQVHSQWLDKFRTERRPGTVKAYLHSLMHLCHFVKTCPSIVEVEQAKIEVLISKINYWLKSLTKSVNRRKWEKREEDLGRIATKEDFHNFEKSEPVRNAIKIISDFMTSEKQIIMKEFTLVRDYLINALLLCNAARSGAVANMTVQNTERAERDGDTMVVTVHDHKTMESCGPAIICMPLVIFTYLGIYLKKMRSRIVGITGNSKHGNVFVTNTGMPMSSSALSGQIGSFWRAAIGKHMNASLLRKSWVSYIHECHPEMKASLACHMNHAVKTAENTYFIQDKRKKSARTSEFMSNVLIESNESADQEVKPADDDEYETLQSIFADNIERRKISTQDVREAAKEHTFVKESVRSVYLKVRYMISKLECPPLPTEFDTPSDRINRMNEEDQPTVVSNERSTRRVATKDRKPCRQQNEMPDERSEELFDGEEDHVSDDLSYATTSEKRYNYSSKENKQIANMFGSFIKSRGTIKEDAIFKLFQETESLRYLTKKLTSRQLTDKIRSMKKAHSYKNRR